jgi:hypothetical protein
LAEPLGRAIPVRTAALTLPVDRTLAAGRPEPSYREPRRQLGRVEDTFVIAVHRTASADQTTSRADPEARP